MARDCSLNVRVAGCPGVLLISLLVGCTPNEANRSDSTLAGNATPSTRAASAERPKVRGERAGKKDNAGEPDGACEAYDTSTTNPPSQLVIQHGMPAAAVKAHVDTLCFAVDNAQVDKWFGAGLLKARIWIQPELRMYHTDPRTLEGAGIVVAKVRNEKWPFDNRKPKHWKADLSKGTDALLWYGREGGKNYAVLFTFRNDSVIELSRGSWEWEKLPIEHRMASAKWNTPHPDKIFPPSPGTKLDHHNGSGWISCTLGCCTATGVNDEP